jgi:hypothetical protein
MIHRPPTEPNLLDGLKKQKYNLRKLGTHQNDQDPNRIVDPDE